MRIDKFLKVSRLLKRRTVANAACTGGRVLVGDRQVKPAYNLKIGDEVTIIFGESELKFIVKSLNEKATKTDSQTLYEIISEKN